jgi:hypothetical protein
MVGKVLQNELVKNEKKNIDMKFMWVTLFSC